VQRHGERREILAVVHSPLDEPLDAIETEVEGAPLDVQQCGGARFVASGLHHGAQRGQERSAPLAVMVEHPPELGLDERGELAPLERRHENEVETERVVGVEALPVTHAGVADAFVSLREGDGQTLDGRRAAEPHDDLRRLGRGRDRSIGDHAQGGVCRRRLRSSHDHADPAFFHDRQQGAAHVAGRGSCRRSDRSRRRCVRRRRHHRCKRPPCEVRSEATSAFEKRSAAGDAPALDIGEKHGARLIRGVTRIALGQQRKADRGTGAIDGDLVDRIDRPHHGEHVQAPPESTVNDNRCPAARRIGVALDDDASARLLAVAAPRMRRPGGKERARLAAMHVDLDDLARPILHDYRVSDDPGEGRDDVLEPPAAQQQVRELAADQFGLLDQLVVPIENQRVHASRDVGERRLAIQGREWQTDALGFLTQRSGRAPEGSPELQDERARPHRIQCSDVGPLIVGRGADARAGGQQQLAAAEEGCDVADFTGVHPPHLAAEMLGTRDDRHSTALEHIEVEHRLYREHPATMPQSEHRRPRMSHRSCLSAIAPVHSLRGVLDCVVIGGGLAGLAAARALRVAGCETVVLEARDRLGGRAWYADNGLGAPVELGGAYIHPSQPNIWGEVKAHDLPIARAPVPRSASWLTQGEVRRGGPPVPFAELPDFERACRAWTQAAHSHLEGADPEALDALSVAAFFGRLDLGPHTLDLLAAFFGEHCSNLWSEGSMLCFAEMLATTGGSITDFVSAATLSPQLAEGTASLVQAIARDAGEVRLAWAVDEVMQDDHSVTLRAAGATVTARSAVIATPVNTWGATRFAPDLSPAKRAMGERGHAGTGLKVMAIVDDSDALSDFALGLGDPFYLVLADRPIADSRRVLVAFGPDADAVDATDRAAVEAGLAQFMPGVRVHASTGHNWTRDPWSRGTWMVPRPGQGGNAESLARPEGRLAFASGDVARLHPSCLEGAIESGRDAAKDILELLARDGITAARVPSF
jgi:monoamine oxidase